MIHINIPKQYKKDMSGVKTSLQLSLPIVLAMLCVLVTGNCMINSDQVPVSALREPTIEAPLADTSETPLAEMKKASPSIAPKFKYDQTVEDVARTYGLDSALLYAVILVESGSNPKAISKKGASGLMQLMPSIAKHYGVVDLLDPVQNLHGGARYLRDMLTLFNNDVSLAVAAYNAGETAVVRYGNHIPPYRETMNYVPRVLNFYRECQEHRPRPSDVLVVTG